MTESSEKELMEFFGPVGFGEYQNAEEWDKPKIVEWMRKVSVMSDKEFIQEASSCILDDALMQRFKGNHSGVYARTTGCYKEAQRRHITAGHSEDCSGDTLYSVAHARAMRSQGYITPEPYSCTCGKEPS